MVRKSCFESAFSSSYVDLVVFVVLCDVITDVSMNLTRSHQVEQSKRKFRIHALMFVVIYNVQDHVSIDRYR